LYVSVLIDIIIYMRNRWRLWIYPQDNDRIPFPKRHQLTSACRQFDTPCFPSYAWVQPLSNQVRASGEALFLAL